MEAGDRIRLYDGFNNYFYTVLEVDNDEEMVRVLNEGTGIEELHPFWSLECLTEVELLEGKEKRKWKRNLM